MKKNRFDLKFVFLEFGVHDLSCSMLTRVGTFHAMQYAKRYANGWKPKEVVADMVVQTVFWGWMSK